MEVSYNDGTPKSSILIYRFFHFKLSNLGLPPGNLDISVVHVVFTNKLHLRGTTLWQNNLGGNHLGWAMGRGSKWGSVVADEGTVCLAQINI